MPGNAFINFGKKDVAIGESLQKSHPGSSGWIEIDSWSWEIEAETNVTKGTGAAVGKATPGNLTISHYWDTSSTVLLSKMVAGRHFELITIEMLKATGGADLKAGAQQTYFRVQITDAFVTKVSTKAGEDGTMDQDVEFVFKDIYVGYRAQNNDGSLGEARDFTWSIKTNNLELASDTKIQKLAKK